MKVTAIVGSMLLVGLVLAGGIRTVYADSPVDDPDSYTVSQTTGPFPVLVPAAAPEVVPDWAQQNDPDSYTTPADNSTYTQYGPSTYPQASDVATAPAPESSAITDYDPDAYTTPLNLPSTTAPAPTDVYLDPDGYTAPQ